MNRRAPISECHCKPQSFIADKNGQTEVIVSLTSFPAAIQYAVATIKSLLEMSVLPDRIVLYQPRKSSVSIKATTATAISG